MIQLLSARFRNFRTLRDVEVPFQRQTVLVGPNNVGKTSVLDGIEYALGIGRRGYGYGEEDISDGVTPYEGFEIRLTFGPYPEAKFEGDLVPLFNTHIDLVEGKDRLFVVVTGRQDEEEDVFRTRTRFAKSDEEFDGPLTQEQRNALGFLVLPAVREARREFGDRGGLWARLGAEAPVSSEALQKLDEASRKLGNTVVEDVLGKSTSMKVSSSVANLVSEVLYGEDELASLDFSALPVDPAQAIRQIELRLATPEHKDGRRVGDHSVGTQSVAMFGLFGAYANAVAGRVVALGIEEPEAHLHPHASRAVVHHVRDLDAQIIITTHSTAVTDASDIRSIVRLRRTAAGTVACPACKSDLTELDLGTIEHSVAQVGTDFLFARTILLTEGESEYLAMPEYARALDIDFDVLGVSVVPVHGISFRPFENLLGEDGLCIPHVVLFDQDASARYVRRLVSEGLLEGSADEATARSVAKQANRFWWSAGDFESCVMIGGGTDLYVQALKDLYGAQTLSSYAKQTNRRLDEADPGFVHDVVTAGRRSKPVLAHHVARLSRAAKRPVPAEIEDVIRHVAAMALAEGRLAIAAPVEANGPEAAPLAGND